MKTALPKKAFSALALAAALTAAAALARRNSMVCSPTAIRPWAAASFDARMEPGAPTVWPSADSTLHPRSTVTPTVASFTLTEPSHHEPVEINWAHYECVKVGPSMEARLPHAPRPLVKLLYWRAGTGPWLSPMDGMPLDPQPTSKLEPNLPSAVSFVLETSDPNVCLHHASLFDRTTKATLSIGSASEFTRSGAKEMRLDVRTGWKHRADLLLEVPVTYGPPEVQELELAEGKTQTFGTHTDVRFLNRGLGSQVMWKLNSGGETSLRHIQWEAPTQTKETGWAAILFFPPGLGAKFEARFPGESKWTNHGDFSQVTFLRSVPVAAKVIELRYLPHAARLQFKLPPPSSLPEVKDLLQVELGDVRFDTQFDLAIQLAEALQVDWQGLLGLDFDRLKFPLELADATPAKIMDLVRERVDAEAYVDTHEFRVKVSRDSTLQRAWAWITHQARRLGL